MISGDNAVSVGAVAAKLGLSGATVDARRLPAGWEEMAGALDEGTVFGRVTRSRSGTWWAPSSRAVTPSR